MEDEVIRDTISVRVGKHLIARFRIEVAPLITTVAVDMRDAEHSPTVCEALLLMAVYSLGLTSDVAHAVQPLLEARGLMSPSADDMHREFRPPCDGLN